MTFHTSDTVRNAHLDSIETAIGASPIMEIRTATQPAGTSDANVGTVLVTIALPSDWMNPASGGSKTKNGTWSDPTADAAGFAGHYRIYANDGVTTHLQGPVAMAWFPSTAFLVSHRVINGSNIYICTAPGTTAASGGPTGTGSGITDGGVTWNYVENAIGVLVADNTNIGTGQPFTVATYTWTDGNA